MVGDARPERRLCLSPEAEDIVLAGSVEWWGPPVAGEGPGREAGTQPHRLLLSSVCG